MKALTKEEVQKRYNTLSNPEKNLVFEDKKYVSNDFIATLDNTQSASAYCEDCTEQEKENLFLSGNYVFFEKD